MSADSIKPNRFEVNVGPLLIAGISETYLFDGPMDAPAQWDKFTPYIGKIDGQKGDVTYGVCYPYKESKSIEYICGVEVSDTNDLPGFFTVKRLPPNKYVIFSHHGHVSTICETIDASGRWVDQSDFEFNTEAGFFFERYGEKFNPQSGTGNMEIWLPIEDS